MLQLELRNLSNVEEQMRSNFENRIGAMTIGVCEPGASANDVKKATRAMMN